MIDYKKILIALMRGAMRRRQMTNDEGAIVGWATNESGEHYPIHEATGGGGKSTASGGKGKTYRITTPDGTRLNYQSIPGQPNKVFNAGTNEVIEM